jgi:hypothetical protein
VDPSTITVAGIGAGVLLVWSALANQHPVDVIRSAFDRRHPIRPLWTGSGRQSVEAPPSPAPASGPGGGTGGGGAPTAQPWQSIDRYLKGRGIKVGAPTIGQTTGGRHVAGSVHYDGRGRDYGRTSNYIGIAHALVHIALDPNGPIEELFGPGVSIDNGRRVPTVPNHDTHTHVGLKKGRYL